MKTKHIISAEQKEEIEAIRKKNKNKSAERRLLALSLRADGKSYAEISEKVGMHPKYIENLVSKYCKEGISSIVENNYKGNRRNMSVEDEAKLLEPFKKEAEAGHIVNVNEIKAAYEKAVGHSIGNGQIYYVLKRQGWRKVMPRSKHPNKATEEEINSSKKLTTVWSSSDIM